MKNLNKILLMTVFGVCALSLSPVMGAAVDAGAVAGAVADIGAQISAVTAEKARLVAELTKLQAALEEDKGDLDLQKEVYEAQLAVSAVDAKLNLLNEQKVAADAASAKDRVFAEQKAAKEKLEQEVSGKIAALDAKLAKRLAATASLEEKSRHNDDVLATLSRKKDELQRHIANQKAELVRVPESIIVYNTKIAELQKGNAELRGAMGTAAKSAKEIIDLINGQTALSLGLGSEGGAAIGALRGLMAKKKP